jgi:hypothetical protein
MKVLRIRRLVYCLEEFAERSAIDHGGIVRKYQLSYNHANKKITTVHVNHKTDCGWYKKNLMTCPDQAQRDTGKRFNPSRHPHGRQSLKNCRVHDWLDVDEMQ